MTRLLPIVFSGCISAFSHPEAPSASPQTNGPTTFHVSRGAYHFGGREGVIDAFHEVFPHAELTEQYDPPGGAFVRVRTRDLEMSLGGKIYGYTMGSVFLFAIPFYNGDTGVEVIFEVFRDGEMIKGYSYALHRHMFVWLPVIPFSWVSAITPSEYAATHAAALTFFHDASATLEEAPTTAPRATTSAHPFPTRAATAAFDAAIAAAQACRDPEGPTGPGKIKVTFDTSGEVVYVDPEAPFSGTAVGECIAKKLQGMRIPAFEGAPTVVARTISLVP